MKITVRQITVTAALLAICIVSQLFKNLSVFITGPIINTCLILAAFYCGPLCGVILSVITPVTAFFITGSPVMAAVPALIPCIMLGNAVLVIAVCLLKDKLKMKTKTGKIVSQALPMVIGSAAKALLMGLLIALWLLPAFLPEKMLPKLPILQTQFSITQLFTALIGSAYALIILQIPFNKIMSDK